MQTISHRKAMYSGVHVHVRGKAPRGFEVLNVKGHVDPDQRTDPEERNRALGNQAVDEVAKSAVADQARPSDAELKEWGFQVGFLKRYLRLVPRALERWPAVGPTLGNQSLPKREGFQADPRSKVTFVSEVLEPMLRMPSPQDGRGSDEHLAPKPLPWYPEYSRHVWSWQAGRWLCIRCLSGSRLAALLGQCVLVWRLTSRV